MPLISALRKQKQVDLSEFEASLIYRASSRTARDSQRNCHQKKKKKKKNHKKQTKINKINKILLYRKHPNLCLTNRIKSLLRQNGLGPQAELSS